MTEFKFYQDNKSKKMGIRYYAPSGNYVPLFVKGIVEKKETVFLTTGLSVNVPPNHKIVIEGAPGVYPVRTVDSPLNELAVEVALEDGISLESGDLFGQFIVAQIATPKKVNTKKDLVE